MDGLPAPFAALELARCEDSDVDELVALFQRCFEPRSAIFQPYSRRRWRWKYLENPHGYRSLVVRAQGRIVAHVGGMSYPFWYRGRERSSLQATDHMVDPLLRRGLRSGALFGWLMGTWMERFCGPTMSFLGWGFPSRGDFRIGQRFLAYECLHMVEVLVHTSIPDLAWSAASLVASEGLGDERELAQLWQLCRAGLPMTVERGPAYLRWRYRARPAARYVCTSVRDAHGALRGACVLRRGGLAEDTLLILEWLVPGDDEEAERALLGLAASHARRLGCSSVALWLFPWQPAFERLRRLGFASHTTALCQTARSYDPATDLQWVREECAWSLGEIDFL